MKMKRRLGNDGRWRMEDGGWTNPLRVMFILPFLLMLSVAVHAEVKATVDNPAVYRGDPVTLTLSASGSDIQFPPLSDIAGYPIESRGSSRNISMINGTTTRTIEQRLVFTPTKDVTIPSLDVTVDGNVEHTLPLQVKVLEPKAAPKGAPVQMVMTLSKDEAYVGEPVELDLVFKYKPGTRIDDIKIAEPKFENFWIKRINTQAERAADDKGYITQTYRYLLFAQQSGDLEIPPIYAQIGTQVQTRRRSMFSDPFFNDPFFGGARMQDSKVYSKPARLHAKALPQGLEVYGAFTMRSDVDKTTVEANKPVNLTIHIEGKGNVEDIKKFDPQIDHAVVYANDPVVKSYFKNGEYYGTFDQTIAIIPDRDITIKPQEFAFYDSRTKQPNTLRTRPYYIKVKGVAPQAHAAAPVVESAATPAAPAASAGTTPGNGIDPVHALELFAGGFVLGAVSLWILLTGRKERSPKRRKVSPMAAQIKKAKKPRDLFELLLPYKGESPLIDTTLDQLEANLYRGAKHKIDRKALIDYFDGRAQEEITLI